MKFQKILTYILGIVACIVFVFIYLFYIRWLGFPDGYLSALDRAEKILFTAFMWFSLIAGLYFICLGLISSQQTLNIRLYIGLFFYLGVMIFVLVVDYYFRLNLDDGAGG